MKNVPELRFPEFKDEDEWEEKKLKDACQMQAGKFVNASQINEKNINDSLYPCYGGNGLRGYTKSYTHDGKYSLIGRQGALCGNITFALNKFHATEHAVVVTLKEHIDTNWLFYKLIHLNLNQYATGQAQPGLSVENLKRIKVEIPKEEKEQQKIADCLSSIDNLITSQSKKVEALKEYKKGLIQQLFPQDGEEVPKLRFPEFKNAPKWEEKELELLSLKISDGIHTTPSYDDNGDYYFINGNNLIDGLIVVNENTKRVSKEEYEKHKRDLNQYSILLSINGTIGNISTYNNEKVVLGKSACYININDKKVNQKFIINFLKTSKVKNFFTLELTGSTIKNLSLKTVKNTKIDLPSRPEQHKIADCLSSIDKLITTQSKKVEALKEHKKGLMQQLFPSREINK